MQVETIWCHCFDLLTKNHLYVLRLLLVTTACDSCYMSFLTRLEHMIEENIRLPILHSEEKPEKKII